MGISLGEGMDAYERVKRREQARKEKYPLLSEVWIIRPFSIQVDLDASGAYPKVSLSPRNKPILHRAVVTEHCQNLEMLKVLILKTEKQESFCLTSVFTSEEEARDKLQEVGSTILDTLAQNEVL